MSFLFPIERFYARWQMGRAVRRLNHPNEAMRAHAEQLLRAGSPACWPLLRRVAFRQRSRLAVTAAELLYILGDSQGLYALLEQFANGSMYGWYGPYLRRALRQVGNEKVLSVLEVALERIETPPLPREDWSLSLAVYALHALKSLNAPVPRAVWKRAITVCVPGFEDLRVCRALLPILPGLDPDPTLTPPLQEWRVGSTLAAVRRAAVDALLALDWPGTFELLRDALGHADPQVQLTAIYGLRRLADARAYVLLQPIAASRRHPLNRDARRAIEALGTREPDALTLVRPSQSATVLPDELLRPAYGSAEQAAETLLRPVGQEQD
jgi:hypothetical protein